MSGTVVPFSAARQPTTVQASVACAQCQWGAIQTGATALEVAQCLRALLLQHVAERHPASAETP
jgi:hypothetical protein